MKRRAAELVIAFSCLILIAMLSIVIFYAVRVSDRSGSSERVENDSFKPSVWRPDWIDKDNNGIADNLDQEIGDRLSSNTAQEYVNVTVMLKSEPTARDADAFISCGGYLTTSPWTQAIYGFGGLIPYNGITNFTQKCSNLFLIEEEAECDWNIAYAAKQVGARPYVWNTLGLQGDSNSSIAILDTGIDASHPDFSSGYGNADFSKKIVGWNDQINTTTASPYDDNGHGSHVSGLAAGDGFFSVDASGNATATWGANFGSVSGSGTYFVSGMMVNKTGTITIKVKWATTGTAKLSALPLYYGDKTLSTGSWTQVASVSTPSQNTFYSLSYNVTSAPSGGYDMYHVLMSLTAGTGNLYVVFTMSWPYTPPADGFSAWTGIAPQAKLVGVKVLDYSGSGTSTGLINGINWIISNRITYHITVASMSLSFASEQSAVDSAVVNLVNSGITTVVAAGNDGSGTNYVYTPGSVDETITVAAMNQFDNVASYSSQGGSSRYTGQTVKPDITAPGGSFYAVPLFSADSNYNDADGQWADVQSNDSASMQGTSMATPVVAGAADLVVQAMGGYNAWNWTRSQALLPKMILLMTATETYPNFREAGNSTTSPTLDRGGKDSQEGYGRLNLDAAVDAVLKTYEIGTNFSDILGTPPTLTNISVLGQRLAWARNVQLVSGFKYNFTLSVPAGADYDLYLYKSAGTTYGEPAIAAKSVNATSGGTEQFTITAPYTGTYYLLIKRATETTGSGTFNLTSSGPVHVNLDTLGLTNATNVVHYIQNSISKNGSIVSNRFSDYVDTGTTLRIDNPIYALTTQRYTTSDPTSFTIQSSANFTARYTEQFWIQVDSSHDLPSPSQWVDRGSDLVVNVTSPADDDGMGTRYRCTGYTLDSNQTITDGSTGYSFANIQNTHDVTFNWIAQYRLTVFSDHDSPDPSGSDNWYDTGSLTNASVTSPAETVEGTRYRCIGWTGVGSAPASGTETSTTFTMTQPSSVTWNWIAQHLITFAQTNVDSDFTDAVVTIDSVSYDRFGVSFWWDNNSIHSFSFQSPLVVTESVKRYSWEDTTGLSTIQSDSSFQVTQPGSITGNYKTQFNVVFAQANVDSDFTDAVVTIDTVDYPASAFPIQFWWENGTFHSFLFSSPLVINATKSYDWISTTGLSTLQAETLLITKSGNVTGDYFVHIRYETTFSQSGVDVDFPRTVVTIDGLDYTAGSLPVSFLWDANSSHTFLFDSPISDGGTTEFIWVSTNGLSTLEGGYLRATASGDIIGNYKRKPTLTMNPTNRICRKYGEAFTVAVTVSDEYDVRGFEFEIHYNTTLLDYVSVNWSAWGSGTMNVDETDGIVTGTTLGPAISGNETLITLEFKAAYYHIWKNENATQGWVNDLEGGIFLESASLSYTDGAILHYAKNGIDEINVGPDIAYTFSPIRGDVDNNGEVDLTDLRIVAAFFDSSNEEYNLTGSTTIDIFDLVVIASNYGYTYTPQ